MPGRSFTLMPDCGACCLCCTMAPRYHPAHEPAAKVAEGGVRGVRGLRAMQLPVPFDQVRDWAPSLRTILQDRADGRLDDARFCDNTDEPGHQHKPPSVKCSQVLLRVSSSNVHIPGSEAVQSHAQTLYLLHHLLKSAAPAEVKLMSLRHSPRKPTRKY
jgi:hypothetical protein